jgi:outer membrane receptor protein involved in Fe transport
MKKFKEQKNWNRRVYWSVISLVSLSCGGTAWAQMDNLAATNSAAMGSSTNVTQLGNVDVVGKLDQARSQILPDLGASAYTINQDQIESGSQGDNAPINQIIYRAPGVAQDNAASDGLHVRGEHANLQYRINGVLLPEGIAGFGSELDPRFIDSLQLITGSLPAEYGFRTAGIINIQTKSGAFENGGAGELYGGSQDTIRPSFEYGGSSGKWSYYVDGSYDHNALGIENPTTSHSAIHDDTDQFKAFTYMSYLIDDTSRVSIIGSASYSNFEVPNTPGLQNDPANYSAPGGAPWYTGGGIPTTFDSSDLNEQQREQNYYLVTTYQKSVGDFNGQFSVYGRQSGVHFRPDQEGDLFFNGVASDDERKLYSTGLQGDASYEIGSHTIRGGIMALDEVVFSQANTTVFPLDGTGNPDGNPFTISQNDRLHGLFAGVYLQDEWKMFSRLTVNYGARFDEFASSFDNENQLSPRINLVYTPTDTTTLHAGYSRYFTPPPIENVSGNEVAVFNGTSNGSDVTTDDPVKAERSDYFDVGVSQKITPHLQLGVDSYYKYAHNQLDDGLFGQSLILSAFNYARGEVFGCEFTGNYTLGGFSSYANVAWSKARGEDWNSAQFLFDSADLAYVQNHWIYLDHDQRVTGSFGMSYTWKEGTRYTTRVSVDALYGSGLRTDETLNDGSVIPNGGSIPAYYTINLGLEQSFKVGKSDILKARLDVINLTDNSYELRDGGGVGVNAASYGQRLGFFGSISLTF